MVLTATTAALLGSAAPALAQVKVGTLHVTGVSVISPFQAQVSGTIECVEGGSFNVNMFIQQTGPRQSIVTGGGNTSERSCEGTGPQEWTATVETFSGSAFGPGTTRVIADSTLCDPFGACSSGHDDRTLRAKRG